MALVALVAATAGAFGLGYLLNNPGQAEFWRDVVIILVAVESMFIGVALLVLIVQLARLIFMLQHEVRPILYSTHDTVNALRGTATFLSNNLVTPVIKLNGYLSALTQMVRLFKPGRGQR